MLVKAQAGKVSVSQQPTLQILQDIAVFLSQKKASTIYKDMAYAELGLKSM